jgi:hypothetical protein
LPIRLRYARGFLKLVWAQGVRSPYRKHFWMNLLGLWRKNPSRLTSYLHTIGLGENLIRIRELLLSEHGMARRGNDFRAPAIQREGAVAGAGGSRGQDAS